MAWDALWVLVVRMSEPLHNRRSRGMGVPAPVCPAGVHRLRRRWGVHRGSSCVLRRPELHGHSLCPKVNRWFRVAEWVCKTEYQGRGTPRWRLTSWTASYVPLHTLQGRTGKAVPVLVKWLASMFRCEVEAAAGVGRLNDINGYVAKGHATVGVGLGGGINTKWQCSCADCVLPAALQVGAMYSGGRDPARSPLGDVRELRPDGDVSAAASGRGKRRRQAAGLQREDVWGVSGGNAPAAQCRGGCPQRASCNGAGADGMQRVLAKRSSSPGRVVRPWHVPAGTGTSGPTAIGANSASPRPRARSRRMLFPQMARSTWRTESTSLACWSTPILGVGMTERPLLLQTALWF